MEGLFKVLILIIALEFSGAADAASITVNFETSAVTEPATAALCDIDGDGKVGLAEAIYALQVVAGLIPQSMPATGSVSGTVTYNGSLGSVTTSSPIYVVMTPFPMEFWQTPNGSSIQFATLTNSPETFTFTNVPPGSYHVVAIFDFNGDDVSVGDPCMIYGGSNYHADPFTEFTVTAGQTTTTDITFGDEFYVGE